MATEEAAHMEEQQYDETEMGEEEEEVSSLISITGSLQVQSVLYFVTIDYRLSARSFASKRVYFLFMFSILPF